MALSHHTVDGWLAFPIHQAIFWRMPRPASFSKVLPAPTKRLTLGLSDEPGPQNGAYVFHGRNLAGLRNDRNRLRGAAAIAASADDLCRRPSVGTSTHGRRTRGIAWKSFANLGENSTQKKLCRSKKKIRVARRTRATRSAPLLNRRCAQSSVP